MRVKSALWMLLGLALAAPAMAQTSGSVSMQINIGDAPPPPTVVFSQEPSVVMVPGTTVYVVNDRSCDYDFFRYGVYWYIWNDGHWYRSRAYRGPFVAIKSKYVPAQIMNVPGKHWKRHPHGGPPGQAKRNHAVAAKAQTKPGKAKGNH